MFIRQWSFLPVPCRPSSLPPSTASLHGGEGRDCMCPAVLRTWSIKNTARAACPSPGRSSLPQSHTEPEGFFPPSLVPSIVSLIWRPHFSHPPRPATLIRPPPPGGASSSSPALARPGPRSSGILDSSSMCRRTCCLATAHQPESSFSQDFLGDQRLTLICRRLRFQTNTSVSLKAGRAHACSAGSTLHSLRRSSMLYTCCAGGAASFFSEVQGLVCWTGHLCVPLSQHCCCSARLLL